MNKLSLFPSLPFPSHSLCFSLLPLFSHFISIFPQGKIYVLYITMTKSKDFEHWMVLAKVSFNDCHCIFGDCYAHTYIRRSISAPILAAELLPLPRMPQTGQITLQIINLIFQSTMIRSVERADYKWWNDEPCQSVKECSGHVYQ